MALDREWSLLKNAGHRRRNDISEPQRRAQHARAVEEPRRDKLAQPRREFVVHHQADMAEEHRQREISAALMIDAGKTAMRDNVERLLAAIIGMRAPADVGHQACRMAEPALLSAFFKAGSRHEAVGPSNQLFAMARRART